MQPYSGTEPDSLQQTCSSNKSRGVVHCLEVLSAKEIAVAIEGFRFLGLTDAGAVLNEAASASLDRLPLDEAERTETYLYESYGRYKRSLSPSR